MTVSRLIPNCAASSLIVFPSWYPRTKASTSWRASLLWMALLVGGKARLGDEVSIPRLAGHLH